MIAVICGSNVRTTTGLLTRTFMIVARDHAFGERFAVDGDVRQFGHQRRDRSKLKGNPRFHYDERPARRDPPVARCGGEGVTRMRVLLGIAALSMTSSRRSRGTRIGAPLPPASLSGFTQTPARSLEDYSGRTVLFEFFAYW